MLRISGSRELQSTSKQVTVPADYHLGQICEIPIFKPYMVLARYLLPCGFNDSLNS